MTSIKPPSAAGPSSIPPASAEAVPGGPDSIASTAAPEGASGASDPAAVAAGAAQSAQGSAAPDAVAELVAAVERGEMTRTQALEALVERAVAGVARELGQAERAELSSALRAAIEADPALRAVLDSTG